MDDKDKDSNDYFSCISSLHILNYGID
jgi:hypothetical protein